MSNQFLSEIHDYISLEIAESQRAAQTAEQKGDVPGLRFHQGMLQEWFVIRNFLDAHFNLSTQRYY